MINDEQIENIKKQLIQQIESNFPEDKKAQAVSQIESMNAKQLEEFLIQNNLIRAQNSGQNIPQGQSQCIFCSIISGEIPSYKIDENKDAVAVLEINPVSKGHAIVIPKEHISKSEKISQNVFSLAKKVAGRIELKLKPKNTTISSSNLFGHEIINILPVYENETLNSERKQADKEELEELRGILGKKEKARTIRKPRIKRISEEKIRLPKRIP